MYLVDTNFLGTLANVYPRDVFPSLWGELEVALFADGVFFHDEVDKELAVWGAPEHNWYKQHVRQDQTILPDQEELDLYQQVVEWVVYDRKPKYREAAATEFFNEADSWLVASARRYGATIVTNEVPAPDSVKKVKIPDVAAQFSVPCISELEFLRRLNIQI